MKRNVLVYPCGSEVGLEINRALSYSTHFNLYGANNIDDHGKFVYSNYINIIACPEKDGFIEELNALIAEYKIDFVIPAHDSTIVFMAEHDALINAEIITSDPETCRLCRSKRNTYLKFDNIIPTPVVYQLRDAFQFPIFLKPDVGQGSRGTYIAHNQEEVDFHYNKDPTLLFLEYLPGKEYTIDCFTDKEGTLLFAEGRVRNRISNGISVNSWHVKNEQFQRIATLINQTLSFRGVWFFQVKERADGEMVLMEISPRIAGTMALFRAMGINFILLSLFDRMNYKVSVMHNNFGSEIDRALFARYHIDAQYNYVYVDFDDTIIVDNVVNTTLMKFLYQCLNEEKKIILITKHLYNILDTLNKFAISPLIFQEIIQLTSIEQKINFIKHSDAIFIDDSFEERKCVARAYQIPTFGLDAIESLLCWKV